MSADPGASFATLTHARIRAVQGDVAGAARILRVILNVQPGHDEARALLDEIEHRLAVKHTEPTEAAALPVTPAKAEDLTRRFREALDANPGRAEIRRLEAWMQRIERNRGARRVR